MIGRRRAFAIGCVIYGIGSLTTALAPNLAVLILGWSVLEGVGAGPWPGEYRTPRRKPSLFGNRQMSGGLLIFLVLYLVQAGMFFTIPLFLSA